MATEIRVIPTLYGETAREFERQAALVEQNPGTEDYRHESEVVMKYLRSLNSPLKYAHPVEPIPQPTEIIEREDDGNVKVVKIGAQKDEVKYSGRPSVRSRKRKQQLVEA